MVCCQHNGELFIRHRDDAVCALHDHKKLSEVCRLLPPREIFTANLNIHFTKIANERLSLFAT